MKCGFGFVIIVHLHYFLVQKDFSRKKLSTLFQYSSWADFEESFCMCVSGKLQMTRLCILILKCYLFYDVYLLLTDSSLLFTFWLCPRLGFLFYIFNLQCCLTDKASTNLPLGETTKYQIISRIKTVLGNHLKIQNVLRLGISFQDYSRICLLPLIWGQMRGGEGSFRMLAPFYNQFALPGLLDFAQPSLLSCQKQNKTYRDLSNYSIYSIFYVHCCLLLQDLLMFNIKVQTIVLSGIQRILTWLTGQDN